MDVESGQIIEVTAGRTAFQTARGLRSADFGLELLILSKWRRAILQHWAKAPSCSAREASKQNPSQSVCLELVLTDSFWSRCVLDMGRYHKNSCMGVWVGKASCLSFPPSAIDAQQEHTSFHSVLLFVTDMWKALSVRLQRDLFSLWQQLMVQHQLFLTMWWPLSYLENPIPSVLGNLFG